jgi:uncharacterized membrane protein
MQPFTITGSLRFGWETLKKRPVVIIGSFVLALIVSSVASAVLDPGEGAPLTLVTALMGICSVVIGMFVELGLTTFSIRAHDAVEGVTPRHLWNPRPFVFYVIGQLLVGLIVVVGLVLLIIPGVIAALTFMFTSYVIIDKGMTPLSALKESRRITKGHVWRLFLFLLALIGFNILGLLALIVGLLITIPVSMIALVHVFRALQHAVPSSHNSFS